MIPYKEASEEMKRQSQLPATYLKAASSLATPLAASSFYGKVAPFLSNFINEDMAIKGLSKINPKLGQFVSEAKKNGYDFEKIKNFLGEKVTETQTNVQEQQPPKEQRNIIEQYSPDLYSFITSEIQKGRSAIEAGAIAQNDKKYQSVINKISKDHKSPWSAIIQTVFGQGQTQPRQPMQQQTTEQPVQPNMLESEQRLMSSVDKLSKMFNL